MTILTHRKSSPICCQQPCFWTAYRDRFDCRYIHSTLDQWPMPQILQTDEYQSSVLYRRRRIFRQMITRWGAVTEIIQPACFIQSLPCNNRVQPQISMVTVKTFNTLEVQNASQTYLHHHSDDWKKPWNFYGSSFTSKTSSVYSKSARFLTGQVSMPLFLHEGRATTVTISIRKEIRRPWQTPILVVH